MPYNNIKKFTALFSLLFCALLLILTVLCAYYVATESTHECHGEDCPICATLEVCEALLSRIGSSLPIMGIATIAYVTCLRSVGFELDIIPERSLVEEKIRMND